MKLLLNVLYKKERYKLVVITKKSYILLALVILIPITSISILKVNKVIIFRGTVQYMDLEGGFYAIIDDNGNGYDPMNLPEQYQVNNSRVFVIARISDNQGSFHMFGTIIEIIFII